ncbi:hypothetical protein, partial [Serratia fonticola]|uniref:hypothetical protein n=1 Tax=Serratia fonticola TaxID=47917 RepID=UPI00301C24CE
LTELCNYGGGKFTASAGSSGMPTNAVAYALDWTPTAGVGGPANGVTGTVTAVALQDVQGTNARTRYYNVCVNGRFLG